MLKLLENELKRAFNKKVKVIVGKNNFEMSIVLKRNSVELTIGKKWINLNPDFAIGELHILLKKMKKYISKDFTIDEQKINLALNFLKHYSDINIPKHQHHELVAIFNELNKKYFNNELTSVRFRWSNGIKTLGSYNYFTNTIVISKYLKQKPELLKYVLYHEMLHKYLKYKYKKRITYHTAEFRKFEKNYPNAEKLENELKSFVRTIMRTKNKINSSRFFLP